MYHPQSARTGKSPVAQWSPDAIVLAEFRVALESYLRETRLRPLLMLGDARHVLRELPDACVDCAMTSPPYWGKREYANGGIGLEADYREYVHHLSEIFAELRRVLRNYLKMANRWYLRYQSRPQASLMSAR
ncbi:MAG: site-specific DNA-methyltransferase [Chloroflexi bacterium]|nr:site-specific DNA-methyltransferase [Chloroflexota bacterium]